MFTPGNSHQEREQKIDMGLTSMLAMSIVLLTLTDCIPKESSADFPFLGRSIPLGRRVREQIIVAGWWYNEIMVTMIEKTKNQFVILEPYIDSTKINEYLAMNYKISYLPEQNIYNDLMYKMNITNKISTPFE